MSKLNFPTTKNDSYPPPYSRPWGLAPRDLFLSYGNGKDIKVVLNLSKFFVCLSYIAKLLHFASTSANFGYCLWKKKTNAILNVIFDHHISRMLYSLSWSCFMFFFDFIYKDRKWLFIRPRETNWKFGLFWKFKNFHFSKPISKIDSSTCKMQICAIRSCKKNKNFQKFKPTLLSLLFS